MTIAEEYARGIVSNKIPANDLAVKAGERFLSDLKRKDIFFDKEEAERFTRFMGNEIHLWEDEWRGKKMEIYPYMGFIIQNLFGWKYTENGKRRFRDAYIQTPKKQAKTTLMAAIIWAHALIDKGCLTPQIIVGANNEDQAKICVNCVGKMVDVSPMLSEFEQEGNLKRYQHGAGYFRITYKDEERDATIEGISKDPKTKAGRNPSLYVIDEYMAAPNDSLLKELHNAQTLRSNPMGVVITTPGFDKQVPCYQKLRKTAVDILNGSLDMDSRFALLFEPDDEEKWDDQEEWKKYIPILFHVPKVLDTLKADFKSAKAEGGHSIVDFKTKNLGMWVDAATVWIPDEDIKKNSHGVTIEELKGKECYIGIDLSKAKDLTVVGYTFPNIKQSIHAHHVQCHIPEAKLDSNEDGVDYRKWADDGLLIVHDGNVIDHDVVAEHALNFMKTVSVRGIGFDQKYAYQGVVTTLAKAGYEELLTPIGQGFTLATAVTECEALLLKHQFDFMNNPIARWNFANVVMKEGDQGHRYPSKAKSGNKIDVVSEFLTSWTEYNHRKSEGEKEIGVVWF